MSQEPEVCLLMLSMKASGWSTHTCVPFDYYYRRLTEWCVFCSKAIDAVKAPAEEAQLSFDKPEGQFIIGDDDDHADAAIDKAEEAERESSSAKASDVDALPPYEPVASTSSPAPQPQPQPSEDRGQRSTNIHYIQASETLHGIALSYGVSLSQLATLNQLPPAAISTQPTLLHTRSFLLLPGDVKSRAPDPLDSPEQAYRKQVLRRFQMTSKCADPSVAEVYVSNAFQKKQKEAEFVTANRQARHTTDEDGDDLPRGGELEDALEAFRLDSKWEKDHAHEMPSSHQQNQRTKKGKWTGLTAPFRSNKAAA